MEVIAIDNGNNGRFVFSFQTLGSYLEIVEFFNKRYKCHDNYWKLKEKDFNRLDPHPFHYLNEPTLTASTPIYVNIAEYISLILNHFPGKYTIETSFYLNGMDQYALVGAELINPEVRLSLIGKRRVKDFETSTKNTSTSTSVKKKSTRGRKKKVVE